MQTLKYNGRAGQFVVALLGILYSKPDYWLGLKFALTQAIEEMEFGLTHNYMAQIRRTMEADGLVQMKRDGKGYKITITEKGFQFYENLPDGFGVEADQDLSAVVKRQPNKRVTIENPMPKEMWKAYWGAFRAGQLDIIFVEKGRGVKLKPKAQ